MLRPDVGSVQIVLCTLVASFVVVVVVPVYVVRFHVCCSVAAYVILRSAAVGSDPVDLLKCIFAS